MSPIIVSPANKKEFLLIRELLDKMKIEYKSLSSNIVDGNDSEDWYKFASLNLSRAYSDNEPEYTSSMIKEPNLDYNSGFKNK